MTQLFRPFKNFLTAGEQPATQEPIMLQFLRRLSSKHHSGPEVRSLDGDDSESRVRLEPSTHFPVYSFSMLRSCMVLRAAWIERFPGPRGGLAGFAILATFMFILNTSALLWTATHLDDSHFATVAVGSYESISNLSGWAHLAINFSSIALVAGSSYCMQYISSPTRAEVDAAHAQGAHLDVGILSWRNVLMSRKKRLCILAALALCSVLMPPVYDTSLLMTTPLYQHTSAIITSDQKIVSYNDVAHRNVSIRLMYSGGKSRDRLRYVQSIIRSNEIRNASLWERIPASDCATYRLLQTDRSTLLIMFNGTLEQIYSNTDPRWAPYKSPMYSYVLQGFLRHDLHPVYPTTEKGWAGSSKWHSRVSYCMSRRVPGRTRLQIHVWLLFTVTVLNALKLGCLLHTIKDRQQTPLITTGDAIASFLGSPCTYTTGMSLLSQREIFSKLKRKIDDAEMDAKAMMKEFKPRRLRFHRAVSASRWIIHISLSMLIVLIAFERYGAIRQLFRQSNPDFNLRSSWKTGLGKMDDHSMTDRTLCGLIYLLPGKKKWLKCKEGHGGLDSMVIASLPQLAVSGIYLSLNHQVTAMIQLRDWTSLAWRRQPLRVSDPEPGSDQVSTYWLSLPMLYSVPLLVTSFLLGWLLSQTIFIVRYDLYDDAIIDNMQSDLYATGYSTIALVCSLGFGLATLGVFAAIGFCKCYPGMPLGPANSLAIAAACHPPEADRFAARKLVKWGAISTRENIEVGDECHYCTITSRRVEYPVEGKWYG